MTSPPSHPRRPYQARKPDDPVKAAETFLDRMKERRSVREFSDRPVPQELIESLIAAAGTAPSGANKQPWRFVAISDPALKREIRMAAEEEERLFYSERANAEWLRDLDPFETGPEKPFIETAPWIVVVFKLMRDDAPDRLSDQVYYVNESVGIAVGLFLAAAQHAGLATLTHTPSPMKFLGRILDRPDNERPFVLIPVGHPADDCTVPDIRRKALDEIMVLNRGEQS